jgi:hypothetical protein
LKPFGIFGVVSLDKDLRLVAENALLRIASISEIMTDVPGRYNFHLRKEKRQLTTSCPSRHEQLSMRDIFAGSLSKINVSGKQLVLPWRFPADAEFRISRHD